MRRNPVLKPTPCHPRERKSARASMRVSARLLERLRQKVALAAHAGTWRGNDGRRSRLPFMVDSVSRIQYQRPALREAWRSKLRSTGSIRHTCHPWPSPATAPALQAYLPSMAIKKAQPGSRRIAPKREGTRGSLSRSGCRQTDRQKCCRWPSFGSACHRSRWCCRSACQRPRRLH